MIRFHYKTYGSPEKKPLLLLHGFMGDSSDFDTLANKLTANFYCIALDLPGHGKTECDDFEDFKIENTTSAIVALLQELKIEKTHLLGYSMGGRIGFYLLIHYHQYLLKTVLESTSPGLKTEDEKEQRIQKDMMLARRMHMQPFDQFLEDWYNMELFASIDKTTEKFKQMLQKKLNNNIEQLALSLKYAGTGIMPSLWDKVATIKSDILLITGSLDTKYCQIAKEIRETHNKISHEIIDDASHNVHFEQEEKFYKTVLNFLT